MLWGVKLYPLQHSWKRRLAPGMDAKEMDFNLFFNLGKKNAAQFASQWGLWHEGRGTREEKEERKSWNAEHQEKIHFLTSVSLLSKKTSIEMPKVLFSLHAGIFRSSGFFSSTMFCCCIPHSPTPLRKLLPCSNYLGDQRTAFGWFSMLSS